MAIAFSPYAEANLHESARIAEMLNADLLLVHVGKKSAEKERKLKRMISQTVLPEERVSVEWRSGDAVNSILEACTAHDVDLLISGAMKQENILKFYTGSVARKLCRQADCSILLLTERSVVRNPCREIVVTGVEHPRTEATVMTANHVGKKLGAERLTIVDEIDPKAISDAADDEEAVAEAARKRKELTCKENERLTELEQKLKNEGSLAVKHRCIFGRSGYTIGHFAASKKADLLVMNAPDKRLGFMDRVFPHDLEHVLSDLPCCLMIVRPKEQTRGK